MHIAKREKYMSAKRIAHVYTAIVLKINEQFKMNFLNIKNSDKILLYEDFNLIRMHSRNKIENVRR